MKHYKKNLILIFFFLSFILLTGCSNFRLTTYNDSDKKENYIEKKDDSNNIDVSSNDDSKDIDEEKSDQTEDDPTDKVAPTPTVIQPTKNIELLIYVVNSSTELDPVTALVPADVEITPELIVDTVVDSMADQSIAIGIESVTTKDDTVIISFYSDQPPLSNMGSGLEISILDALAQSVTENLDEYNKIIYRVEGGPYRSGHIELGIDEIYFED
ncbi:MAG: hypothetical protein GX271_11430 [Clostridiales bacterium]|jgi:hypothetical protein|nr:hypothetical protein [Clostridiales bacterium]